MNFASAGVGSVSHLNFEVFKDKTGMEAVHVPYKGGGQAMHDVRGRPRPHDHHVGAGHQGPGREAGKLKALAVTGATRSPAMPNVPTMQEAGVKAADVELRFWFAVLAPKGLPDDVKARLAQALLTVINDQHVRERLANLDITPEFAPPAALRAKLDNEIRNWSRFIDEKGIKPE